MRIAARPDADGAVRGAAVQRPGKPEPALHRESVDRTGARSPLVRQIQPILVHEHRLMLQP